MKMFSERHRLACLPDHEFGRELLRRTALRKTDGFVISEEAGLAVEKQLVRAAESLPREGLVVVHRTAGRVRAAQLTNAGMRLALNLAAATSDDDG